MALQRKNYIKRSNVFNLQIISGQLSNMGVLQHILAHQPQMSVTQGI